MSKANRGRADARPRRLLPWGDLPRGEESARNGILLVDKPQGATSHDVVGAVRRLASTRKVGHAGTLDPMATGLLTIGIGRATKLLTYLTGADKTYEATIVLGLATTTEDADGEVIAPTDLEIEKLRSISPEDIDRGIDTLTGHIDQVPSAVSAKKIDGRRAHDLVREGKSVELESRPVTISAFERISDVLQITRHEHETLQFDVTVTCSAGTYIRALARDLGNDLGVGAHLTMLRRSRVGQWSVTEAAAVEELGELIATGGKLPVTTIDDVCARYFPRITVSDDEAAALQKGMFIDKRNVEGERGAGLPVAAFTIDGKAIALVSPRAGKLKPDLQLISPDGEN